MIFEEVKLYNFGIYQGHHTISLDSPNYQKPVILIGALNGAGKTTFLDALQLALYGKFAKCSNRGRLGYLAFLEKNINSFSKEKEASVSLRFRHGDDNKKPQVYEIRRSWKKELSKECKEETFVTFNGEYDQLLSEHWDDFVNEFIPQSISELFFFDGEKIENLADPKRSAELLKTGIEALLGLEMLSKLSSDLKVLKRKKQESLLGKGETTELEILRTQIRKFENLYAQLQSDLEQIEQKETSDNILIQAVKEKLLVNGADKINLKDDYENEKNIIIQNLFEVKHELKKIVSYSLPLSLIKDLAANTKNQLLIEKETINFKNSRELLEEQKNYFIRLLSKELKDENSLQVIKLEIQKKSNFDAKKYKDDVFLNSDPIHFEGLEERIYNDKRTAKKLIKQKNELDEKLILAKRKITAIPSFDSVKGLIEENAIIESEFQRTQTKKHQLIQDIEEVKAKIKNLEDEYSVILLKNNSINFEQKRQNQIINHIDLLNNIVLDFNTQLVHENIHKLERNIKSKFDLLKRKDSLVKKITIDPHDFSITLMRSNIEVISPERLSAGERQLFAIAILWGLADTSGKELPTIIDTPMGRLDGEHRTRLIEEYFPQAASQVILLSTDEEIYGTYYKKLKPYISQEYTIIYDEENNSSYINSGYIKVSV